MSKPPIKKLKPGRARKTLRFDYKKPVSPSKMFTHATPFSRIKFDREKFENVNDFIDYNLFTLERKRGSENEAARRERESREAAIQMLAGKIDFTELFSTAPRSCTECGEAIPGSDKRYHVVLIEQEGVGVSVSTVDLCATLCAECRGASMVEVCETPDDEAWVSKLSPFELQVYRLHKKGKIQQEIEKITGKHQTTIGRTLKRIEGKRQAAKQPA